MNLLQSRSKGVSEVVSFVLILAVIIVTTLAAYLWATQSIEGLNEPGRIKSFINQMTGLDDVIRSTAHGDINFTNTFKLTAPDGFIEVREDADLLVLSFIQKAQVLGYASKKGILIQWNTTLETNATIEWGLNTDTLGNVTINTTYALAHYQGLYELDAGKTFYYNITSCDIFGNCNETGVYNFTT